jgi:hypothetical protein
MVDGGEDVRHDHRLNAKTGGKDQPWKRCNPDSKATLISPSAFALAHSLTLNGSIADAVGGDGMPEEIRDRELINRINLCS